MRARFPANLSQGQLAEAVLLETITHHLMDIVVVTDAALDEPGPRLLYVNDRFTELTGYSPAEVIGRSPRLLQGPDTDRRTLDRVRQALEAGIQVTETIVNYARDGTRYELEMRIVPLLGPGGRPSHFVAIERDVTRERARRAQRERMGTLLASLVHALPFGVVVYDEAERCVLANTPALGLLRTSLDRATGQQLSDLLPGYDPVRHVHGGPDPIAVLAAPGTPPGEMIRIESLPLLPGASRFAVLRVDPAPASGAPADSPASLPPGAVPTSADGSAATQRIVAGRMQLVGLDAVRDALGAKWAARRDAIFDIAEKVLERRLATRDVWQRQGEDGYVVVFAELDERAARFKAAAIAEEIRETLVGSGDAGIGLTTAVAELEVPQPVALERPSLMSAISAGIDAATAALENRVRDRLHAELDRPTLRFDQMRLAGGGLLALRVRLAQSLEDDIAMAREALADPSRALLEVQSFLLAQAVRHLTDASDGLTRPLVVPFDPAIMDSRRSWTELLDIARRIPAQLRRRLLPVLDGRRPVDTAYRLSDAASTLGQIFGQAGLVHPTRGGLRFIAERCRLRFVVVCADELPDSADEEKRFERLLTDIRMTRAKLVIDLCHGRRPGALPPHDMTIVPAEP